MDHVMGNSWSFTPLVSSLINEVVHQHDYRKEGDEMLHNFDYVEAFEVSFFDIGLKKEHSTFRCMSAGVLPQVSLHTVSRQSSFCNHVNYYYIQKGVITSLKKQNTYKPTS